MLLATLTILAWLALIFAVPNPERRSDMEWHGRNTIAVPPPVPDVGTHPDAADAPVR